MLIYSGSDAKSGRSFFIMGKRLNVVFCNRGIWISYPGYLLKGGFMYSHVQYLHTDGGWYKAYFSNTKITIC